VVGSTKKITTTNKHW